METDKVCTYISVDIITTKELDERRKRSTPKEYYYNKLREDEAVSSE